MIAGPAGSISTVAHGGYHGLGYGHGLVGHGLYGGVLNAGYGLHGGYAGSGHEGQWIPDINEKLYDDGSYRPEHHYSHGHGYDGHY